MARTKVHVRKPKYVKMLAQDGDRLRVLKLNFRMMRPRKSNTAEVTDAEVVSAALDALAREFEMEGAHVTG